MKFFDVSKLEGLKKAWGDNVDPCESLESLRDGRKLSFKSLLGVEDLSDEDMRLIFDLAWFFKYCILPFSGQKKFSFLRGTSIINFFCEESTRTKGSFELAGKHLGSDTISISKNSSSMQKKGEILNDTARTLNKMQANCIIIRDKHALAPAMIAKEVDLPVINAGDGCHEHPTQALLDAFTILEEFDGNVHGRTIAVIGDIVHSRVAGSLLRMAKRLGMDTRMVAPRTFIPSESEKVFGAQIFYEMNEGIKGVDIAYVLRVQMERAASGFIPSIRDYSKLYSMNKARLPLIASHGIVMHPGPINREVDISTDVMEGSQSRVEAQVFNGLAVRMSLLYLMVKPNL